MKKKQMKLAFDIDGVVADFNSVMADEIKNRYNFDINKTNNQFKYQVPGVNDNQLYKIVGYVIKNRSHEIKPYYNSIKALENYYELTGEPVYFVTARHITNEQVTNNWLNKNVTVPYKLALGVGSPHKANHLIKRGYDSFVDDRYSTVINLSEKLNKVFLMNRKWNHGREVPENVKRINSLNDIIKEVC